MADFDITELCARARVTPRTVHFYVQQGLLPPAGSPGPGARYTEGHVSRIRLIRLLQKEHLPLAEIGRRTRGLSDEQVDALIAETKQRRAEPKGTALDYIRGILTPSATPRPEPDVTVFRKAASRSQMHEPLLSMTPSPGPMPTAPARSQWDRFTLADGIEIHVRRPLSREDQRQLEKLMAAARRIFHETEEQEQL